MFVKSLKTKKYKNRIVGLALFGIIQILMGLVAGAIAVFALSLSDRLPSERMYFSVIIFNLCILCFAVFSIWLGIGTILARRWAWALTLMASWFLLAVGSIDIFFVIWNNLTSLTKTAAKYSELSSSSVAAIQWGVTSIVFVFLVLLPLAFVLFFRSPNVKATCEARNHAKSWTDRKPLPVLGFCLLLVIGAVVFLPFLAFFNFATMFFGIIFSGFPGFLVILLAGSFHLYLAWGIFQRRIHALWLAAFYFTIWYLPSAIFMTPEKMQEFYQRMKFPIEDVSTTMENGMLDGQRFIMLAMLAVVLGYLFWLRKYFPKKNSRKKKRSVFVRKARKIFLRKR